MELNTYITPSNNEFKERIRETRYMSYNNVLSDEIKMLMDIDIVRDLANKAMHINNQLPYDVASLTARQIYLGEPITGIEIPMIEEEEEIINNDIIIEEPIFNKEDIIDDIIEEEIIDEVQEEIIEDSNDEIIDEVKEEIIEDSNEDIIDEVQEEIIEESNEEIIDDVENELEKTFDLSNMLSELPMGMLDEIPYKNMLDELPLGDDIKKDDELIIDDSLLEGLQKENKDDLLKITDEVINNSLDETVKEDSLDKLLDVLPENDNLLSNLPDIDNTQLIDNLSDKVLKDEPALENLPEIKGIEKDTLDNLLEEMPKQEELLDSLPETKLEDDSLKLNDGLDDLMVGLDNALPEHENLTKFSNNNTIESQSNDLLATLTNGFTMDFLDEPVVQKVKTR